MNDSDSDESIATDRLRGVRQIAEEINETTRRTYYLLESGLIPAGKLGGIQIQAAKIGQPIRRKAVLTERRANRQYAWTDGPRA